MKFSLYTVVAILAATVAAESFTPEEREVAAEDFAFDTLEERASAGTPAKCTKYAKMVPKCAVGPIKSCTMKAGCNPNNYKCGCAHKSAITQCASGKVLAACGSAGAQKAISATNKLCKCAK